MNILPSSVGIAAVFRDFHCHILAIVFKRISGRFSVKIVELLAIRESWRLVVEWGVQVLIIESNALKVIQRLNSTISLKEVDIIYCDVMTLMSKVNCSPLVSDSELGFL